MHFGEAFYAQNCSIEDNGACESLCEIARSCVSGPLQYPNGDVAVENANPNLHDVVKTA